MKIIQNALLIIGLLSCFAFTTTTVEDTSDLIGIWVPDTSDKEGNIYKKLEDFEEDKPGIRFLKDGTLLKRQNVGWCGTPPISYGLYDGTWKVEDGTKLKITYQYWGGMIEEEMSIIDLTSNKMKVLSTKFETIEKE